MISVILASYKPMHLASYFTPNQLLTKEPNQSRALHH